MNWHTYLRGLRRFERHSAKEILLQQVLPRDWERVVPLAQTDHEVFDLADSALYDPERNCPHQRGAIQGFILENGVLWPALGAVRTEEGQLIEESFFDDTSRQLALERGYANRFPQVEDRGVAATLGHFYRNYYHRFADSIPRIYALYHPVIQRHDTVRLYIDDRFSEDELRIIRHLVPGNVEVEIINPATRVKAVRCVHLPYLSSDRVEHSKWFEASVGFLPRECLDWLRDEVYALTGIHPTEPSRKLYVTRRNAKVRRLINEEEVAGYLRERGFEVVALEKRPLREQVQLFAEAALVVAQHGAGLVNLLFSRDVRVLEVCSDEDRQIFFRLLSEARGFPHLQLHRDGEDKNADVVLPLSELEEGLETLRRMNPAVVTDKH